MPYMKKIFCYGDSNTFGFNPNNYKRYDNTTRWTSILKHDLKDEFEIIECGENNLCGFLDNGIEKFSNKINNLKELDIILIAVGANDLQTAHNISDYDLELGLKKYIEIVKNKFNKAKIILISPPIIKKEVLSHGMFSSMFNEISIEKSLSAQKIYNEVAKKTSTLIFNFNDFIEPSNIDGLHYDENGHKKIAEELVPFIKNLDIIDYSCFLNLLQQDLDNMFENQKEYVKCSIKCSSCCKNADFPYSELEKKYLLFGFELLEDGIKEKIKKNIEKLKKEDNARYNCPFLIDDMCCVYDFRGIVCRAFGLLTLNSKNKPSVPTCASFGLNFSDIFDKNTNEIDFKKYKELGYKNAPVLYNLDYEHILESDLAKRLNLEFKNVKKLLDWL